MTESGSGLSGVYVTASAGISGISVFKTGRSRYLGAVTVLAVYVNSVIGSGMVSINAIFGNVLGERTAGNGHSAVSNKVAGVIFPCRVLSSRLKCTAADGCSSCEIVYAAILTFKATAADHGSTPVSDHVIVITGYRKATVDDIKLSGNADTIDAVYDELTAINSKLTLDNESVVIIHRRNCKRIITKCPSLYGVNNKLAVKNYILEKHYSFAVICSCNSFCKSTVLIIANLGFSAGKNSNF